MLIRECKKIRMGKTPYPLLDDAILLHTAKQSEQRITVTEKKVLSKTNFISLLIFVHINFRTTGFKHNYAHVDFSVTQSKYYFTPVDFRLRPFLQ